MIRWLMILGGGVAALAAIAYGALQVPAVQDALIVRVASSEIGVTRGDLMADDALRVIFCGTSSPFPDTARAKACTIVIAGGKFYVVDTGPESTEVLLRMRLPMLKIGGVLLTHFHSDHIGELGELNMQSWAQGRPAPLPVYGPPGVERVVSGFMEAFALDQTYRTAHHGADLMAPESWPMSPKPIALEGMMTPIRNRKGLALQDGDLTVTALEMSHAPAEPAYGYRFDYKGRSVVITGDTAKHLPLAEHAKDADVLIHEAQAKHIVESLIAGAKASGNPRMTKIFSDIQTYHASPVEAAEIANAAGVKLLVLTHFTPQPNNMVVSAAFTRGMSAARKGEWMMARDGTLITLPLGAKDRIETATLP